MTSEEKFDYYDVVEVTRRCLGQVNVSYIEILITPLRTGYRVEIYPQQVRQLLEVLAHCMSKLLEATIEVKEYPHGTVLVVKR